MRGVRTDFAVDGVEKFKSKKLSARVDDCPNCGAPIKTEKEKIGLKSRNLEQIRRMSVDKKPPPHLFRGGF